MKEEPRIEGAKVVLRPLQSDDANEMFRIIQSPELTRLTGSQTTHTLAQVRDWYAGLSEKDDRVDFAITLPGTGELIGETVINEIDRPNSRANFRILLDVDRAGKGYGTEATLLTVRYGFEVLNLNRSELSVFDFNPHALRVYEKVGFVHEGVRRESLWWDGEPYDEIMMALLKREFVGKRS